MREENQAKKWEQWSDLKGKLLVSPFATKITICVTQGKAKMEKAETQWDTIACIGSWFGQNSLVQGTEQLGRSLTTLISFVALFVLNVTRDH